MFSLLLQMAKSFWCIVRGGAMRASYSVEFRRILGGIAPGFDWFFHLLHRFEDDMPY